LSAAIDWKARLGRYSLPEGATLMEVCGTHTMTARRAGIHSLLPEGVRLLAGPGCPVCVSPIDFIDQAVAMCREPGVVVASYGDLLRVPGSRESLTQARATGGSVRIVYSPIDALELARSDRETIVVFLGVGFETTAPTAAAALAEAAQEKLENFTVLSAHRVVPPALEALLSTTDVEAPEGFRIDGFLAPGHVSTIVGLEPYRFVAEEHGRPVVVAGFSPEDMLLGIDATLRQIAEGRAEVENAYKRAVRAEGNPAARALLDRVFEPIDAAWRGIGTIPASGLGIRDVDGFARHDAELRVPVDVPPGVEPKGCRCGTILKGLATPEDCPLFRKACTPEHPVGACMVSSEGACAAAFKYGKG
jgi:hydrogenase expression/formation protein HypD